MRHPWSDRIGALAYVVRRRLAWRLRFSNRKHSEHGADGPRLMYLMPGHGMTHEGSAWYPVDGGFRDVADWVYARSRDVGFDVESIAAGRSSSNGNYGGIHQQLCLVYRDNLVHFFWFLRKLAECEIDPVAYLVREGRLLPAYHSSGLFALLYIAGSASWEDADCLATGEEPRQYQEETEIRNAECDIEELRRIDPDRADPVTQEAVGTLVRSLRKIGFEGADAVERVYRQTAGSVSLEDRENLIRLLKGKLICLAGFGPRPYGREDVERLLNYCNGRGICVDLSVVNGSDLYVIGGRALHVARAEVVARRGLAGRTPFKVSRVVVDGAPHTRLYVDGVRRYEAFVDRLVLEGRLREPAIPFVGRHGRLVVTVEQVRNEVLHLMDETYDFQIVCKTAVRHGARWLLTGGSGEQSAGRRVVKANLMDAAMGEMGGSRRFASTDGFSDGSCKEREILLRELRQNAVQWGTCRAVSTLAWRDLPRMQDLWESGLEARRLRNQRKDGPGSRAVAEPNLVEIH